MKLIIDIDDSYVNIINKNGASNYEEEVIVNGIPLEDIRYEIDGIYIGYRHGYEVITDVLAILDKHISGKENK